MPAMTLDATLLRRRTTIWALATETREHRRSDIVGVRVSIVGGGLGRFLGIALLGLLSTGPSCEMTSRAWGFGFFECRSAWRSSAVVRLFRFISSLFLRQQKFKALPRRIWIS